jgi:FkbM family methyltransferase
MRYKARRLANRLLLGRLLDCYKLIGGYRTDIIEGRKITYNPYTDIGHELFFHGTFEKDELDLCKKYIKEDSIVLDIGANIGLHSIFYSRIAEKGLVLSFEPSHETFMLLLKNTYGIINILPINVALSDSTMITKFFIASDNAYSSLKDTNRKRITNLQKTLSFKLDDLVLNMNLSRIDFIKIDVEGFEQQVLEGMNHTIEVYRPVIFCEIYKGTSSNEDPDKTVTFLLEKKYDAFIFDGKNLIPYSKHDDRLYNYFFLPRKQ